VQSQGSRGDTKAVPVIHTMYLDLAVKDPAVLVSALPALSLPPTLSPSQMRQRCMTGYDCLQDALYPAVYPVYKPGAVAAVVAQLEGEMCAAARYTRLVSTSFSLPINLPCHPALALSDKCKHAV
jgi:hypothetical protein